MGDEVGAIRYLGHPTSQAAWWSLYGLDEIWPMVRDEDGVASYTQIAAWQRMAELCTEQADQLQRALDQLMLHWPPHPGSASEQFKIILNVMIASMRESSTAAGSVRQPLADITMELARAKDDVALLLAQKADYESQEQLSTRGVYPGRGATVAPPPGGVPPAGWRESLDRQARQVMSTADVNVGAVVGQILIPARYRLTTRSDDSRPLDPGSSGANRARLGNADTTVTPIFDPPAPASGLAGGGLQSGDSQGPVLTGGIMRALGEGNPLGVTPWDRASDKQPRWSTPPAGVMASQAVLFGASGWVGSALPSEPGSTARSDTLSSSASASGTGSTVMPGSRGLASGSRSSSGGIVPGGRRRRRSDPTDPWQVPQGGPSRLEPSIDSDDHDPGAGVIGIDR